MWPKCLTVFNWTINFRLNDLSVAVVSTKYCLQRTDDRKLKIHGISIILLIKWPCNGSSDSLNRILISFCQQNENLISKWVNRIKQIGRFNISRNWLSHQLMVIRYRFLQKNKFSVNNSDRSICSMWFLLVAGDSSAISSSIQSVRMRAEMERILNMRRNHE